MTTWHVVNASLVLVVLCPARYSVSGLALEALCVPPFPEWFSRLYREKVSNFVVPAVSNNPEGVPPSEPVAGLEAQGPDDGELVRLARKGQLKAFDQLVGRYQRQATAVAYRLLNNMDDAMEIVQDAFLNAYDKLESLSQASRFGPWFLRIVSNLALNRRRARMLRKASSLDAVDDEDQDRPEAYLADEKQEGPEAAASTKDVQRLISRALEELPEMQRQALVLFSIENRPQKEVAEILGCSVEAVKWHVFTARKKLKDKLRDYL